MKKDKSILAVNFCRSNCVLFWIICGNCVKKGVDGVTIMSGLGVVRSHALSLIPLVVPTCYIAKPKACRYKWVIFHLSLSCI